MQLHDEPELAFGHNRLSVDPKEGLLLHGPFTLGEQGRHPVDIGLGLVGVDADISDLQSWLDKCRLPIAAKVDQPLLHPSFPGYSGQSPFRSDIVLRDEWRAKVFPKEIDRLVQIADPSARFQYAVDLLFEKITLLADRDDAPRVIAVAVPSEIIRLCWSITAASTSESQTAESRIEARIMKRRRRHENSEQLKLFADAVDVPAETRSRLIHRNFRRALKARAMKYNVPIQMVQPNIGGAAKQPPSTVAWNFFVALYYKAGGFPWVLGQMDSSHCFVGVSFHRHVTETKAGIYSSLAQVFSNRAEGIVLRGEKFQWNEKLGKHPHLSAADAKALVAKTVREYERVHDTKPSRVVIHKTSTYWPDELAGFKDGLSVVADYDLVSLSQRATRLFREGDYPPLRGTHACIAGTQHILYTMGYIPFLRGYPRGYVPDPIEVTDHHGGSSAERICREVLSLTKMNWNCADHATATPITLRFARQVGEVMSEIPDNESPRSSFRFYM